MLKVRTRFTRNWQIRSNATLDMGFPKDLGLELILYSYSIRDFIKSWPINSDPWSYVISICLGYLESVSSPRWEKLPSGYHNYPLKGLIWSTCILVKNNFLNKLKYINTSRRNWCLYWYVFIFINFGFKVRYMHRKLTVFFREVTF